MAKRIKLLSATFPCAANAAIVAKRGLTMDASTRGNVKLPASTPEKTFVGVAVANQSPSGVEVQTHGIAEIESDGSAVVNPGDYLILVGTTGRCKAQAIAAGSAATYNIIGMCVNDAQVAATAGLIVQVQLGPFIATGA
jgi:hypothetical protein